MTLIVDLEWSDGGSNELKVQVAFISINISHDLVSFNFTTGKLVRPNEWILIYRLRIRDLFKQTGIVWTLVVN
jgi:hypothetical protein